MAVSFKQIFKATEPTDVESAQRQAELANALQRRALQPTMTGGPAAYDGRTAMVDLASALTAAYNAKRANAAYDRAKTANAQKVDTALRDYSKSTPDEDVGRQSLSNIMASPDDQLPQTVTSRTDAASDLASAAGPEAQQALAIAMMNRDMGPKTKANTHVVGNTLVDDDGKVIYQAEALDNMYGRINPGDFTPASLAKYSKTKDFNDLERVWAPPAPTVVNLAGGQSVVAPTRDGKVPPKVTTLTTAEQEQAAAQALATAKAEGGAVGDARGAQDAKAPAKASFQLATDNMRKSIGSATQGGPLGIKGRMGALFDYGDNRLFDSRREQLSTELRTVFRIPGEGTLSDQEQRQYGLQLPSVLNPPEVNEQIMKDLEGRVKLRTETPVTQQGAAPAQAAAPAAAAGSVPTFATEKEAEAAGIKPGTKVIVGGVSGVWQ
jgi:hypothetical protein